MKGKDGTARAAYVAAKGRRIVIVHVFAKTRKTAPRDLETARRRAEEVG